MNPLDICQSHLDKLSLTTLAGDFKGCRRCMVIPLHLQTAQRPMVVNTEAELLAHFNAFAAMLRVRQITELIQLA